MIPKDYPLNIAVTPFVRALVTGGYQPGVSVQFGDDIPRRTVYDVTFESETQALTLARDIAREERKYIQKSVQTIVDSLRKHWENE